MRLLLPCAIFLISLAACSKPKTLEYKGIELIGVQLADAGKVSLDVNIRLYNPNSYPLKEWEVDALCFIKGTEAGSVRLDTLLLLPGQIETKIPISALISSSQLLSSGIELMLGKSIPYNIVGKAKAGKGSVKWTIPFDQKGAFSRKDLESLLF